jgi:uncharacterized metal-binding protein YceD (DUF177 family)
MTQDLPLSRPLSVDAIPGLGLDMVVEAKDTERALLARAYGLVSIDRLVGTFRIDKRGRTVHVTGTVKATVMQTCVVSLEPFPAEVDETVEVKFVEPPTRERDEEGEHEVQLDAPDPIVGGRIDLGAVTAEFLSLALDPYPRKPGTDFAWGAPEADEESPFAGLAGLKQPDKA